MSVRSVQNAILHAKGYLLPYLDVPVDDIRFASYQRIGSTGILKGEGRSVDWSNQTWLRAEERLLASELEGLSEVYPYTDFSQEKNVPVKLERLIGIIQHIAGKEQIEGDMLKESEKIWNKYGLQDFNLKRNVSRGEMAVLVDCLLDPFNMKEVDVRGEFID